MNHLYHCLLIILPVMVYVFAQAIQTINLAERRLLATFLTSVLIASANLLILKVVPKIDSLEDSLLYVMSCSTAVTIAVYRYPKKKA